MECLDMRRMSVSLRRNAAGETREICALPSAKRNFYWHTSTTSITASGEFFLFPDIERIVTLLGGGEMFLEGAGRLNHTLKPLQPFSLAADLMVRVKPAARQVSMDFNIMTHLDACKAKIRIAGHTSTTFGSCGGVVLVVSGTWQLGDKLLTIDRGVC